MSKITHPTQTEILKALLFEESLSFSELNKLAQPDMSSDNFNFHLKKLLDLGLVEKQGEKYVLGNKGVEFASRIDLGDTRVFKQPKLSVALAIFEDKSEERILLSRRKYQPLKGVWGFHTEKMRIGESWDDGVARCLKNEVGVLKYKSVKYGITHLLRTEEDTLLADVIHVHFKIFPENPGEVLAEMEDIQNEWAQVEDVIKNYETTEAFKVIFKKLIAGEFVAEEFKVTGRM